MFLLSDGIEQSLQFILIERNVYGWLVLAEDFVHLIAPLMICAKKEMVSDDRCPPILDTIPFIRYLEREGVKGLCECWRLVYRQIMESEPIVSDSGSVDAAPKFAELIVVDIDFAILGVPEFSVVLAFSPLGVDGFNP